MKVELSDQVVAFVRRQAPEPRQRLRRALRRLEAEQGDIHALEGRLANYHRLRVGAYRILFTYVAAPGARPPSIRCIFAERRDIVYAVFSEVLKRQLLGE